MNCFFKGLIGAGVDEEDDDDEDGVGRSLFAREPRNQLRGFLKVKIKITKITEDTKICKFLLFF